MGGGGIYSEKAQRQEITTQLREQNRRFQVVKRCSRRVSKGNIMKDLVKIVKEFELYPAGNRDSIKYFKHGNDQIILVYK